MMLIRCTPTPESLVRIILYSMVDAFQDDLEIANTVERYEAGECTLWAVPEKGFIIISVETTHDDDGGETVLVVEYGAGFQFYTRENINLLVGLARHYNADLIECYTKSTRVNHLLNRRGFVTVGNYDRFTLQLDTEKWAANQAQKQAQQLT